MGDLIWGLQLDFNTKISTQSLFSNSMYRNMTTLVQLQYTTYSPKTTGKKQNPGKGEMGQGLRRGACPSSSNVLPIP